MLAITLNRNKKPANALLWNSCGLLHIAIAEDFLVVCCKNQQ